MQVPFASRGNRYDKDDIDSLVDLLSQDENYNKWEHIRGFESDWSQMFGSKYALSVTSGTAALHLALKAIDLKPDDEVITSPWTWVATGNVVLLEGATPVFVDIDPLTMNFDIDQVEKSITSKTKAVIAVNFAGRPCDLERLGKICAENNIYLIQDAAHAAGASFNGNSIENYGDFVCYSFYTQKNLSTLGEGGMVTCHKEALYDKLKLFQNHGVVYLNHYQNPTTMARPWLRECIEPGYNYRMSEAAAVVGRSQLKKLTSMNAQREILAQQYITSLAGVEGIITPLMPEKSVSGWHFFVIQVTKDFPLTRDDLYKKMGDKGVQCNVHYTPLYKFKPFSIGESLQGKLFPSSELCYDQVLSLPLYPTMSLDMLNYVCKTIENIQKGADERL
jgi:perosamine synthetase